MRRLVHNPLVVAGLALALLALPGGAAATAHAEPASAPSSEPLATDTATKDTEADAELSPATLAPDIATEAATMAAEVIEPDAEASDADPALAPPTPDADMDANMEAEAADLSPEPVAADTGAEAEAAPAVIELSLEAAIRRGVENNLDVEIVRYDPLVAELDYRAALGAYDPLLGGNFSLGNRRLPVAGVFQSDAEGERSGDAGISGLLPLLGWSYELSYRGRRVASTSPIQSLNPEYTASLEASLNAPLLRGFLLGPARTEVRSTRIGRALAREGFRRQLMDTIAGIESGYWNLAARRKDFEVNRKSLETARVLRDQAEVQYEVGMVSRVEVIEARAGVADREYRLIQAENEFLAAQDQLIDQVLGTQLQADTRLTLHPTDSPEDWQPLEVDEQIAADKAFALRPELAEARRRREQLELQVRFAFNQRLPQLDLVARYGTHGLAGIANPQRFACLDLDPGEDCPPLDPPPLPGFSDTDADFFEGRNNRSWSGGAVFSIPLGNRTERARHRRAKVQLQQARTRTRRIEQSIILEVRDAVRNLRSATRGIEAAERRVAAASEQLRAEQIRLEHGESTPFAVLQREEDLVEAESQKTRALQVYHNSVASLNRAQGTILRDHNIVVDEALPLR